MTTRKQKFQALKQELAAMATVDFLVDNVTGVVGEVITNKWPDVTKLTMVLSVGDAKRLGGFWQEQWIVCDFVAMFVGRIARALVIKSGLNLDIDELQELLLSTDDTEEKAIALLMHALKAKFGEVPVDIEFNKKKQNELHMMTGVPIDYKARTVTSNG